MEQSAIITAKDLSYRFRDGYCVLDALNFSVQPGSFTSFIGPSGSGKTTLLHLLGGLYQRFSGQLTIAETSLSFVFQEDNLLEWKSALDNVLLPFAVAGEVTPEHRDRALQSLGEVGLQGFEQHFPGQLSGGMKKRVELARALVTGPKLLILDEPFSSLDILTRERLNVLVRDLHRSSGTTVVLVTHSIEEACFLSDTVHVLSQGPGATIAQTLDMATRRNTDVAVGGTEDKPIGSFSAAVPSPVDEGLFALSPSEYKANIELRSSALELWGNAVAQTTAAPVKTQGKESSKGAFWLRGLKNSAIYLAQIPLILVLLLVIKGVFSVPDLLIPDPWGIVTRWFASFSDPRIMADVATTIIESMGGFLIALVLTLVLGYSIAKSKRLGRVLMPGLIVANTIPSVALAPFLVLWLGFGIAPKIVTAIIVIFFPMLINNLSAFVDADKRIGSLKAFYRPGWHKAFVLFELPAALPQIFSGIKVSITLSVIGAVVGEFVSGSEGLGALVGRAKAHFDIELMFVGLIWLALLGLSYYGIASLAHGLLTRHHPRRVRK